MGYSRDEIATLVMKESPEMSLPHGNNVLTLGNMKTCEDVSISDELTESQKQLVRNLSAEF